MAIIFMPDNKNNNLAKSHQEKINLV